MSADGPTGSLNLLDVIVVCSVNAGPPVGLMLGVNISLFLRPVILGVIILNRGVLCSLFVCRENTRKNVNCGPLRASERLVCEVAELSEKETCWFTWVSSARRLLTEQVVCLPLGYAGLVRFNTVVIPVRHGASSRPALPLVVRRT